MVSLGNTLSVQLWRTHPNFAKVHIIFCRAVRCSITTNQANEANVRGGFAAMSMETRGNMSFLGPELIAKGFRDLEQLHTVACKATDRGESLVHLFKIFCPSKTKPKGAGSYLARVQEAVDKAIRAKNRELLGTASTAGRPRSSSSRSRSRRGSP